MIDSKTEHYQLPLPDPRNRLEEDAGRLREALIGVDIACKGIENKIPDTEQIQQDLLDLQESIDQSAKQADFLWHADPGSQSMMHYNVDGSVHQVIDTVQGQTRTATFTYVSGLLTQVITTYNGVQQVETLQYQNGQLTGVQRSRGGIA